MGSILTLNPGSSSLKAALFASKVSENPAKIQTWNKSIKDESAFKSALNEILEEAGSHGEVIAVGCRVVDGGPDLTDSIVVDESVMGQLRKAAELAPLHAGESLLAIQAARELSPNLTIVATFDTAFHRTLSEVASAYAIPRELAERYQIRRYGFHGLAYRSVTRSLRNAGLLPYNLVASQLGSGCSVCAIQDGQSVDTSMGFTPLEGLVMGTRSGTIDPGLLLFLLKHGYDYDRLSDLLNRKSGLLGLSGESSNLKDLEKSSDPNSQFAIAVFCFSAAKHLASMAVSMGGLDGLSFSGGIGEHSSQVRRLICAQLEFLGFRLDPSIEPSGEIPSNVASPGSKPIWIVPADEELEIALDTERIVLR